MSSHNLHTENFAHLFPGEGAVAAVQVSPPGVYIAMSGQVFAAGEVRKNRAENRFEATGRN